MSPLETESSVPSASPLQPPAYRERALSLVGVLECGPIQHLEARVHLAVTDGCRSPGSPTLTKLSEPQTQTRTYLASHWAGKGLRGDPPRDKGPRPLLPPDPWVQSCPTPGHQEQEGGRHTSRGPRRDPISNQWLTRGTGGHMLPSRTSSPSIPQTRKRLEKEGDGHSHSAPSTRGLPESPGKPGHATSLPPLCRGWLRPGPPHAPRGHSLGGGL